MYQDKTLVCRDCGSDFVFTAGEQEFYAVKGFMNEPSRCKGCRDTKKAQFNDGASRKTREMFDAVCSECGKATKLPFRPRMEKPVYCSDCFAAQR